jgi:hypothetical protein
VKCEPLLVPGCVPWITALMQQETPACTICSGPASYACKPCFSSNFVSHV